MIRVQNGGGVFSGLLKVQIFFWVLEIPDIFCGERSMLGPSLHMKKKIRAPPPPPGIMSILQKHGVPRIMSPYTKMSRGVQGDFVLHLQKSLRSNAINHWLVAVRSHIFHLKIQ